MPPECVGHQPRDAVGGTAGREADDARSYPERNVNLVVGFAAGGPTDGVTRLVADALGRHFRRSFVVENRVGANGAVAAQSMKGLPADGYTLLLGGSGTMVVAPNLNERVPYDTLRDFTPIARVSDYPYFLVVPGDSPFTTARELIDEGRRKRTQMSYASAGPGAGNHLAGEWFKAGAGIDAVHLPYKGDAAALADVLAGRVTFAFLAGIVAGPHVKTGKLKVLGVSSLRPGRGGEGVPLVADAAGIPGFAVEPWTGIFAPAGMAPALVDKLNRAVLQVMDAPETRQRLEAIGQFPRTSSPEAFRAYILAEDARWAKVIRDARIPKQAA
ncbi:MAG: tripartite tricarboxylate transporter substrate binding protein [Comamonadaceae bacterium]|nr:MAG: tripartite tricarboxylate transporter substrate binding protein [Comamonadaceae bacterium]